MSVKFFVTSCSVYELASVKLHRTAKNAVMKYMLSSLVLSFTGFCLFFHGGSNPVFRFCRYIGNSVQNLLSSSLLSKTLKIKIYRTIILPVVLYGCEAWSLTLREERRLRVFENRVLRRVFGPKRDEVTGMEKIT